MNTARVGLCLTILLAWTITSPLMAQQYTPPVRTVAGSFPEDDAPEVDDIHTQSLFDNRNYMIRSDAGDGLGYLRGFQTFAGFQPLMIEDNLILWVSPRGYVTYNAGTFGGNLGAGARWLDPATQRILGAGFWWDHDNNGIKQYDQLGGSAEWLGNYFDLRGNLYFPTTNHANLVTKFTNPGAIFIGHNIDIVNTSIFNSPLTGGDFEGGGALPGLGDVGGRIYAGGYYYQGPGSGGGVYGVRGRLEALVTQNVWGTVAVTHDRLFGTNVTAAATIYLGTGQDSRWFQRIPMQTRLFQQMERQYRVAVQQEVQQEFALALRAGGTGGSGGPVGTPIFVDHVNNTAAAGGDGSFEHPFNHLPTSTPSNVDIIFVNRGDGTSRNMDQGIALNNFQRLLGQGVPHLFTALQGTFVLPGFSPGPLPTITNVNPGGDAVTLASSNEVSGFNIVGASRHGIFGSGITNFNINNVNITNSGTATPTPVGDGIHIDNAVGTGLITSSRFSSNTVNGVAIGSTLGSGAAALNLTVDSDTFVRNAANGLEIANNGPATGGQTINATVTRSTFSTNTGMGLRVDDNNAFTNLTVGDGVNPALGNTFTNNGSAGLGYFTLGTPTPFSTPSVVNIMNNTFAGTTVGSDPLAKGDAIFFSLRGGQVVPAVNPRNVDVNIANNTITTSARDGIHMEIRDLVFLPTFDINGNAIHNNTGSGISILTNNGTSVTPRIPNGQMNNNVVTLNGGNGVVFTAGADTVDEWTLTGNKFNQNTGAGLSVTTNQNAVFLINSTGDQFVSNGANGVQLTSNDATAIGTLFANPAINGGTPTPIAFTNDTITNNGGIGLAMTSNTSSTFFAQVHGSTIQNNTSDGLNLTTNGASSMSVNVGGVAAGQGNTISNNKGNGVNLNTTGASLLTVDFESNMIASNALDGVRGTHGGGTISNAQVVFGSFLPFTPGSVVEATFNNNLVTLNGGRGFNVDFTGLAGGGYTLTHNTINSNGQEGVFLQTNSGLRTNTFVDVTENSFNSGAFTAPASTVLSVAGNSISWVDPTVLNNVVFIATDNTIRNNGADGMFLLVGTTGYVHADVQRNNFGGNVLTDFRTASQLASVGGVGLQTLPDVIVTARAAGTPNVLEVRQVFLDNVARLDLRFTGNGLPPLPAADSMANATAFGATYNANSVKNGLGATTSPITHGDIFFRRNAGFFLVENDGGAGGTIDTNNIFQEDINNGLTPFGILTNPLTGGYGVVPTGTFTPPLPPLVIP